MDMLRGGLPEVLGCLRRLCPSLSCWKPLSLQLATSWYGSFRQLEDQVANHTQVNATCDEKMQEIVRLQLYDTWQRTKAAFEEKLADL